MTSATVRRQRVSQKAATTRAQPYALSSLLRAATAERVRGSARSRTALNVCTRRSGSPACAQAAPS
jgi:hypothetical protein